MLGRTTPRTSIRGRLAAALGSALLLSSMFGTVVPVAAAGPLSITNVDSPDPVQSGSQIVYTVTVTNTGGAKVNDVHLTDQINGVVGLGNPPLLDVTSSRGSCSQTNTQISCNALSIEGNGVWTVTIRGIVTAAGGTTINNIATVVATKSAQTYTTSASATTQVQGTGPGGPSPDLTIAKNGPLTVTPDGTITYTLTVNNVGTANALGVKVTDTLPAAVTITSVSATSLFVCPVPVAPDKTVVCTGGRVNAGANATITVNGSVAAAAAGDLENTSVVDPDNTIDEGVLGNTADAAELNNFSNTVITHVSPLPPPVTDRIFLDKTGPASAIPNQLIQYTVKVTNGTYGRADYLTMTDGTQGLQAASLHVLSAIATSGTTPVCTVAAPTVTCTMTRLSASTTTTPQTMTVVIEGMVVAPAGSTIINSAAVNANIKNVGYTARDEVQTIINAGRDLTISKSGTPDPVCARSFPNSGTADCRGGLKYTFIVGNSGVQDALNVVVRDPLPAGTTFDAAASDPRCGVASGVVTCTIAILAGGTTATIEIVVVAPATLGTITNTVTVDPSNAIFESDETNNIAVATTTVATGIDLTVVKTDAPPGFDPIATSGTQTYTITVDNAGTQDASGIRVRDTLPAGTTFLSVTADNGFTCSYATGIVECIGGAIHGSYWETYLGNGPDDATIVIRLFAMPNIGTMHNVVRVDPLNEIAEYDETNNIAFQDTAVGTGNAGQGAFNQLTIVKTQTSPAGAPPPSVATNGTLIYNLHVENLGTDPVSNVVVKDFLPTGSRFVAAHDTGLGSAAFFCSHDGSATGGVITCTGGDLSGTFNTIPFVPTSRDITITVFAPNTPGTYTNLATVDPDHLVPEGNEFDNDSSIVTVVGVGGANPFNELTIAKTQTDPVPSACPPTCPANRVATSSIVTWAIVATNTGSDPAFNVRLTDTLPTGFTFISALDTTGPSDPFRFVCVPAAGNTVDCTGATLSGNPNAAGTNPTSRTVILQAFSSAIPGQYTNTAIIDPANAIPEGNETNNTANATVKVSPGGPGPFIDLQIKKTGPAQATPGAQMEYDLHVSNIGASDAFNVTVRDVLPPYVTFFNAADFVVGTGMFTCSYVSGVVTCNGGTIPAGGSRDIRILVLAPASIEQFASDQGNIVIGITNQASIDPNNAIAEGDETNNSDSVDTTIKSKINLTITKEGPDTANQGDTTDYVIKVKNNAIDGGAIAFGVKVVDPLPIGLIPLSVKADPSNFQCSLTENPVNSITCVGDMAIGQEVTITVHVFVTADGGALDNEACVDPNHTVAETNELDNCQHKITDVTTPAPNLLMSKSADTNTVTAGQQFTYTLTVSNIGDGPTTAPVTVADTLPTQVTLVNVNPDAAFTCAPSTTVVSCTLPSLAPGEAQSIKVIVTVNAGVTAPFINTATASGGGDPTPSSHSLKTFIGGAGIDLVLADVQDQPDPVAAGAVVTYTISVINTGTNDSGPFDVTQVFDSLTGMTLVSAVGSEGFTCGLTSVTVTCHGDLLAGKNTILTIKFDTDASAVPSVSSTITVDSGNVVFESNEGNNTDTEVTSISADICSSCIDLVMGPIFATPDPVANNGDVTWNFDVTNIGDLPTSTDPGPHNVVIAVNVDTAFNEYSSVVASASNPGFTCVVNAPPVFPAGPGTPEVICTGTNLNAGESVIISVTATANTAADPSFLGFDAAVDPGFQITEFNEANNTGSHSVTVDTPPPGP